MLRLLFFLPLSSKSSGYFHKLKGMNRTCGAIVASLVPSPRRNAGRPLPTWRRIEMALGTAGSSSPSARAVLRVRRGPAGRTRLEGSRCLVIAQPVHPCGPEEAPTRCTPGASASAAGSLRGLGSRGGGVAGVGSVMVLRTRGFREAPTD